MLSSSSSSAIPDGGGGGGGGGGGSSSSSSSASATVQIGHVIASGVSKSSSAAKSTALSALAAFVEATQGEGGENLPPVEELTAEHVTKESFWGSFIFCKWGACSTLAYAHACN